MPQLIRTPMSLVPTCRKRTVKNIWRLRSLDSFGIGRETDNTFDNLLIYGRYSDEERYEQLVGNDPHYGEPAYQAYLRDYLEGRA